MNNSNMTSGKPSGIAAFIGKKLFGKKKVAPKVKQMPQDMADDVTPTPTNMPKQTVPVPKGIAVGNPKKINR